MDLVHLEGVYLVHRLLVRLASGAGSLDLVRQLKVDLVHLLLRSGAAGEFEGIIDTRATGGAERASTARSAASGNCCAPLCAAVIRRLPRSPLLLCAWRRTDIPFQKQIYRKTRSGAFYL